MDGPIIKNDLTGRDLRLAADQIQGRRFPSPIWANQASQLTLWHFEIKSRDSFEAAEGNADISHQKLMCVHWARSIAGLASLEATGVRRARDMRFANVSAAPAKPLGMTSTTTTKSPPIINVHVSRNASDSDRAP
ncbi:hypothetical protein D9M72_467540 [compost metagenome]